MSDVEPSAAPASDPLDELITLAGTRRRPGQPPSPPPPCEPEALPAAERLNGRNKSALDTRPNRVEQSDDPPRAHAGDQIDAPEIDHRTPPYSAESHIRRHPTRTVSRKGFRIAGAFIEQYSEAG